MKVIAAIVLVAALGVASWLLLRKPTEAPSLASKEDVREAPAQPARPSSARALAAVATPERNNAPTAVAPGPIGKLPAPAPSGSALDQSVPLVHRALIGAIRTRQGTPAEKRAAMMKALTDSGVSREEWTRAAPGVFESWRSAMGDLQGKLTMKEAECFQAGCAAEIRFPNIAAYNEASARLRTLSEPGGQHGGRVLTPPNHLPNGEVVGNWIMMSRTPGG